MLRRFLACLLGHHTLRLVIGPPEREDTMVELDALQQFTLKVVGGRDRKGNPAALEGVVITSSDDQVATVEVIDAADPGFVRIRGAGPGACDIKIEADAHIGDGVTPVSKLLEVAVKAPEAVDVDLEVGELENQP